MDFDTKHVALRPEHVAPDGSNVKVLLQLDRGGMALFELGSGETSCGVAHKTVDEIWYVVHGRGEMWRRKGDHEEIVELGPGVCLSIPVGTEFQFRCLGREALAVIGITMPPWPGSGEARPVDGRWAPTVPRGPL